MTDTTDTDKPLIDETKTDEGTTEKNETEKIMTYNAIIVRYGEISLKGKNRKTFEHQLKRDIKRFLEQQAIAYSKVLLRRGRIYITGIDALPELEKVMGVYSYSPAMYVPRNLESLYQEVMAFVPFVREAKSFRVSCQRVDKTFPVKSVDVERYAGHLLYEETKTKVNLVHPELECHIEIGDGGIFLFCEKIPAYGGMPYGSAGKLVTLISSGIDSPVATFLMMKRGVEPILLHFIMSETDSQKVYRLKEKLEEYTAGRKLKLHMISREDIFKGKFSQIYNSPRYHSFTCVLCKYLMHKKAAEIAELEGALGLITGDNLAQVASQTLKNLFAYRTISGLPVYSPLISFEKQQTMAIARNIGTYELSIAQAKGCTPPKNPKTGVAMGTFRRILKETGLDEPADAADAGDSESKDS